MIKNVTIPARLCTCEICFYEWITILAADRVPVNCQNRECRSREWNGKKPKSVPKQKPVLVLPKVVKVRGGSEDEQF